MKIAIISDTHSLPIPSRLLSALPFVDMIVHAGDICDIDTLKALQKIKEVKAVQGNMCDTQLKKKLPLKEYFEYEGVKIGVCHGHEGPSKDALTNARAQFKGQSPDVIIFGHSHQAFNQSIGGVLLLNPGSPNDAVRAKFFSYGLLEISKGRIIKAEIIKL